MRVRYARPPYATGARARPASPTRSFTRVGACASVALPPPLPPSNVHRYPSTSSPAGAEFVWPPLSGRCLRCRSSTYAFWSCLYRGAPLLDTLLRSAERGGAKAPKLPCCGLCAGWPSRGTFVILRPASPLLGDLMGSVVLLWGASSPLTRARNSLRSGRAGVRPASFRRPCSPCFARVALGLLPPTLLCRSRGSGFPLPPVGFAPPPSGRAVVATLPFFFGYRVARRRKVPR